MRSKPNANFFVKHSSEEKFSFEVYSHTKNSLKLDQIQIKFATSSNWNKTSEKVSYLRLMCHLQKPYADFYETWLINIHSVCRSRPFFLSVWTAGFIVQFEFSRRRHIKVPDTSRHCGRWNRVYTEWFSTMKFCFGSWGWTRHSIILHYFLLDESWLYCYQAKNKQTKKRKIKKVAALFYGWRMAGDGWRVAVKEVIKLLFETRHFSFPLI